MPQMCGWAITPHAMLGPSQPGSHAKAHPSLRPMIVSFLQCCPSIGLGGRHSQTLCLLRMYFSSAMAVSVHADYNLINRTAKCPLATCAVSDPLVKQHSRRKNASRDAMDAQKSHAGQCSLPVKHYHSGIQHPKRPMTDPPSTKQKATW